MTSTTHYITHHGPVSILKNVKCHTLPWQQGLEDEQW
eukprot:CAMPEP_0119468112 /NCGR_PEP_ID=MMETSP1344-20130328/2009_1 /TAXON_ID=236787 /ORGANISM="Florenciella parvula, Strain CCMP2471" /LENGTH=36 /DNA_ID= /DNA_START= /DNA_END= /DNA_ORIENTATION=